MISISETRQSLSQTYVPPSTKLVVSISSSLDKPSYFVYTTSFSTFRDHLQHIKIEMLKMKCPNPNLCEGWCSRNSQTVTGFNVIIAKSILIHSVKPLCNKNFNKFRQESHCVVLATVSSKFLGENLQQFLYQIDMNRSCLIRNTFQLGAEKQLKRHFFAYFWNTPSIYSSHHSASVLPPSIRTEYVYPFCLLAYAILIYSDFRGVWYSYFIFYRNSC